MPVTKLVIRDARILPMTGERPELTRGDLVIEDGVLTHVGAPLGPERLDSLREAGADVLEARGMVAMPGLVNCHNHAAMTYFRGYSDDLRLMDWLTKAIWPAEARIQAEDVYWGTLLCAAEMIRGGTTAFADMYYFMDEAARAVAQSGLRGALARGLVFLDGQGDERLAETRELHAAWNGGADGRISVWVGPHAPYTVPPEWMKKTLALAGELGAPIHIHVSETQEEVDGIQRDYGKSPVQYLADLGLFEHHVLAAHVVKPSSADMELMRNMRGGVSHNPVSNAKLGCGVAPVVEMRRRGITVGLGTDGAGSATTLDMFEEIKAAAWMAKNDSGDPTALTAYDVLRMATVEGAKVLGLADRIGTLESGKQGDVILIDIDKPHLVPHTDIPALLAYSANAGDVDTTIVAGRVLMRRRHLLTIDMDEAMARTQAGAERVIGGQ